jgi:folate-binding protein YgfZ
MEMTEYNAAALHAGFIVRTDRAMLRMYGRDPMRIIQGIVTNDVANAPADRVVYAALLTPKGRMVADMRVIRRGTEMLLDVPLIALDPLLELFRKSVPPLFARFENVTASYAMVGVYGPDARGVVASAIGALPEIADLDGFAALQFNNADVLAMTTNETTDGDVDLVVPAGDVAAVEAALRAAGAVSIDDRTLDVLRIENGTPRWGAELDETTIPLEANLLPRAISTGKGCYTGQEVIIRILHRGHVNWILRGLLLGDATAPARGTQLTQHESTKPFARVTSATWSPRHQQTIALAYVRREIEAGTELVTTDGAHVRVSPLPFAG